MGTNTKKPVTLQQIMDEPKKQLLINFIERESYVEFKYIEQNGFHNIEILSAPEIAIMNLIENKPWYVMVHVSAITNRLEFFVDKD